MKSLVHLTGKSKRTAALVVCLGLFAFMSSLNANADGRGYGYGYGKHQKPPKHHYSQHHYKKFSHDKHWKHRDHYRYDDRRYRSSYDGRGFSFNLWSYQPIEPRYRSHRPDYHYHNHGERCYSRHTQLYINTR